MVTFFTFLFKGGSRKTLIIAILLGALSGLAGAGLIAIVSQVFSNSATLESQDLIRYVILLTGLVVFSVALDLIAKWYFLTYSASRHRELHLTFSKIVLNDSLRHTEQVGIARLITIYAEDMSLIGAALNQFAGVGISFFVIFGSLIYLATLSVSILFITLVVSVLAAICYRLIHRVSVKWARKAFVHRDKHVSQFKDMVHGIGELKLNYKKRQQYLELDYIPTVYKHERQYVRSMLMNLFANAWIQIVFFALMIVMLLYIVMSNMDPIILGPYLVVALFMRSHVSSLIAGIPMWSRAGVTLERMHSQGYTDLNRIRVLNQPSDTPLAVDGDIKLEIDNLTWRYTSEVDDSQFTVGPLSVEMNAGEIVFLVGHNGAGKTTLAKLISGLYANDNGRLLCNDVLIDDSNRTSYNELFSMLFSDPFVFERLTLPEATAAHTEGDSGSIEPISSSDPDKRIAHYLEKLQLHYKVSVKDQLLSSVSLSSGQRKRLALLAAYLEDKPIMIFDEWAENQDPTFKKVFYNELLQELKAQGKLVLVISHEAQFYSVADRVITLNSSDSGSTKIEADQAN